MTFIGIISDNKSFDEIKENIPLENMKLIHINNKSIDNIKNITFETIIINKELKNLEEKINVIENICNKSKYLIINTDIKLDLNLGNNKKINIITYGLNQKATVTISSITDNSILIDLQRNIKNKFGEMVEVGEKQVKTSEIDNKRTYEILIIYIILAIYNKRIILKTQENSNFFE